MGKLKSRLKKTIFLFLHPMVIDNESVSISLKVWVVTITVVIWGIMLYAATPYIGLLSVIYTFPMILSSSALSSRLASPIISSISGYINIMYFKYIGIFSSSVLIHIISVHFLFFLIAYFISMLVYYCIVYRKEKEYSIKRAKFLHKGLTKAVESIPVDIEKTCIRCNNVKLKNKSWISTDEYISRFTKFKVSHDICPKCVKDEMSLRGSGSAPVKITKKEVDR